MRLFPGKKNFRSLRRAAAKIEEGGLVSGYAGTYDQAEPRNRPDQKIEHEPMSSRTRLRKNAPDLSHTL